MLYEYRFQIETVGRIEAETVKEAEKKVKKLLAPMGIYAKKLSIIQIEPPLPPEAPEPQKPPFNKPTGGGSPGTPIVRIPVSESA